MAVEWGLGVPQGNPGQSFQQGYQNALVQRQQQEDRQLQLQQRDMQMQQAQQQQQVQLTERHQRDIRLGAGIARRIEQQTGRPMDEAGWQMVRQSAQQAGADLTDVPEHFDPNYYQGLQAAAQQIESQSGPAYTLGAGDRRFDAGNNVVATGGPDITHQPNIQREADYYRRPVSEGGLGRPDLAEQLLRNHAEGSPVVFDVNHDGVPDLVSREYIRGQSGQGGSQPPPQPPHVMTDEEMRAAEQGGTTPASSTGGWPTPVLDNRPSPYPTHAPGRAGPRGPRTFR